MELYLSKKYQKLYKRLPKFECVEGCHMCCGQIPFHPWEANKVGIKEGLQLDDDCQFICKNGCSIYEDRPFMCRLFGVVDDDRLRCHEGGKAEYQITSELAEELTTEYILLHVLEKEKEKEK
jgi:Fe-S-cluster containining protein